MAEEQAVAVTALEDVKTVAVQGAKGHVRTIVPQHVRTHVGKAVAKHVPEHVPVCVKKHVLVLVLLLAKVNAMEVARKAAQLLADIPVHHQAEDYLDMI